METSPITTTPETSKTAPKRKRPHQFIVRMNDEEYEKYQKQVAKSGLVANEYNIKCLNNKMIIQRSVEELTILATIQKQMSAIGNNLNQLTKVCNENKGKNLTPKLEVLERIKDEVKVAWQSLKQVREGSH